MVAQYNTRTLLLIGKEAVDLLASSSVLVVGLGGVGSYAVEMLARCGVGRLGLWDMDTVEMSNINRQLIALHSTLGQAKTKVESSRIKDINPACTIECYESFFTGETSQKEILRTYDFIIDAIDSVKSKINLIVEAKTLGVNIISVMGTARHFSPLSLTITDIFKTHTCPLCKVARLQLRKLGIESLDCVFSKEPPVHIGANESLPSLPFVPSVAGIMAASFVVEKLTHLHTVS